jgi:hypothetical protein
VRLSAYNETYACLATVGAVHGGPDQRRGAAHWGAWTGWHMQGKKVGGVLRAATHTAESSRLHQLRGIPLTMLPPVHISALPEAVAAPPLQPIEHPVIGVPIGLSPVPRPNPDLPC